MPAWQAVTAQGVLLPALAELATVFWLLVFGVKRPAKGETYRGCRMTAQK